jgi:hypothetical protein
MKIKLNVQAIRVAEMLLKKPFNKFDLSDEETLVTLLYGIVSENNEETFTLHSFRKVFKQKKMRHEIIEKFTKEVEYMNQFRKESSGEGDDMYMGELAALLIQSGMDAHFVLYEMKLFEIGDYVKAIGESKKESMENERFWTYLKILPHVNGKKLRKPEALITFPWEKEAKTKSLDEEFERGVKIFAKFINSKPNE